jgi:4-amino-4-deoxy-L-arabinose transferase-like glycosyltransferase
LFDEEAAWIATLCLLGVELLWRFSVSGLSTMLLLLIVSGLFWLMHLLETEARQQKPGLKRIVFLSVGAGLLVGLAALTRYSTLWMIIPVVAFLITFGARYRFLSSGIVVAVFLLLLLPWVGRNIHLSGLPFGTATHAVVETTPGGEYPEDELQRSLHADVQGSDYLQARYKLVQNLRTVAEEDLMNLGGTWVPWFFAAGLMVAFRNPATQRLRYFVLMALGTFVIVQALGKTKLSVDTPTVNSENLLILLLPALVIYGVAFFLMLLDNIRWSAPVFRRIVVVLFVIVSAMSLLLTLAPPRTNAVVYPPYFPPDIQKIGSWMKEDELMMSDIPWAVAWYGDRQCMWLTLNAQDDFYAINDYQKAVRGLYLSRATTDAKLFSVFRGSELTWGRFAITALNNQVPEGFTLRSSVTPGRLLSGQVFLADWARWRASSDSE